MNDRKDLLTVIDDMCKQLESLTRRAERYVAAATTAENEMTRSLELAGETQAKINRLNVELDDAIAELRGRKVNAA